MAEPKTTSDRIAVWIAISGIIGAFGGAAITASFGYFAHQNDLDAKMIELSIGILRAEPTPETTPLREWAIDVIDKRANFKFNAAQRTTLLKKQLPFKEGLNFYLWNPDTKQVEPF